MAQPVTVHMIGNAHLDPVWLWPWPEGLEAARATFRSALDRMKETPAFIFTAAQAAIYQWIEQTDPAMFDEIRAAVARGQWCLAGGWWMQPDCNIPSGESFVRQALQGQRYFLEKLGRTARVGYNVDSFGHNAMLPQILSKSGLEAYFFMRPDPHEKTLPANLFLWQSPDGTQLPTFRLGMSYNTGDEDLDTKVEQACRMIASEPRGVRHVMCFFGVGNHGGGPTKRSIQSLLRLAADGNTERRVRFSSPEAFCDAVAASGAELPVAADDLQHHAPGCYAVHSAIKKTNRQAEYRLLAAERFSVLAANLAAHPYPQQALTRAWRNVLFCQFHDILAGTSIVEAYNDVAHLQGEALAITDEATHFAVHSIASRIDTTGDGQAIVAFNPHSWPVRTPVEVEFIGFGDREVDLLDSDGRSVPAQRIPTSSVTGAWRTRLTFVADLPPLGWRVFHARPLDSRWQENRDGQPVIGNDWLRLKLSATSGPIAGLLDQRTGRPVFSGPAAVGIVIDDPSDTWSHGVTRYDNEIGRFQVTSVEPQQSGPVRSAWRVASRFEQSTMIQDFFVYPELPWIECRATVDWHGHRQMLKLSFPVNVAQPVATYSIPFGHIVRPTDGEEEPGHAWVDVSGDGAGLSLVNDAKYSYDVRGNDLRLTVLRSPVYAHHDPTKLEPGVSYRYIDQGVQTFRYALLPHSGDWRAAGTVRLAEELNTPPIAWAESGHVGTLPPQSSFARVGDAAVCISALKAAEDGDGWIVRCYETHGRPAGAHIDLPGLHRRWQSHFGPSEIKTFHVPADASQPVREVNLVERSA